VVVGEATLVGALPEPVADIAAAVAGACRLLLSAGPQRAWPGETKVWGRAGVRPVKPCSVKLDWDSCRNKCLQVLPDTVSWRADDALEETKRPFGKSCCEEVQEN